MPNSTDEYAAFQAARFALDAIIEGNWKVADRYLRQARNLVGDYKAWELLFNALNDLAEAGDLPSTD